jgi:hypothetical protein
MSETMVLKTIKTYLTRTSFLVTLLAGITINCFGQINEPGHTPVYDYLYRMANKGLTTLPDYQLPLDRRTIFSALTQLTATKEKLSGIERSELAFYMQDFAFDSLDADTLQKLTILKKDAANRLRAFSYEDGGNKIFVDPVFGTAYFSSNDRHNHHYYSGVRLGGYFGKQWGFNFFFRENTEKGDSLQRDRVTSPEEGIVPTVATNRLLNYSNLNFNLSYRWSNGLLSIGKDNLSWGYGISGNIMLSGKAPSFPYIKLEFRPWKWLNFSYFHGWLQSNIIDSAASYNTGTGTIDSRREIYRPKFIAHHAITITPVKGLDLALGESMVYSDKLDFAYLIPLNFFRAYDHYNSRYNIKAGDNAQFFSLISSRNHIKNTHLYAEVFVDEITLSRVFSSTKHRNQLGYTLGISRTDLFAHYLTAGIEYARINPFVYNNLIPTQTYQSHEYNLGDWMGNNADRLYLFLQYTPVPRLKIKAWHQKIRKGAAGTLDQQYFQRPQPPFLFGKLYEYKETGATASYEWFNKMLLFFKITKSGYQPTNTAEQSTGSIKIGFSYGL